MPSTKQKSEPIPAPVLFIGHSPDLRELTEWAARHGFTTVAGHPNRTLLCAIADDDVLHGSGKTEDASLIHEAHDLGLPCLNPSQASAFLASAADAYRGVGARPRPGTTRCRGAAP